MFDLKFLKQYITHPRSVGAIAPSSKNLAEMMMKRIDFEHAQCIAEFGPGTGVFTDLLIERKKKDTILLVFETNDIFYKELNKKYGNELNVFFIHDSAANIQKYLNDMVILDVDYIVSGLPFASLPKKVSEKILRNSHDVLSDNGAFITFQYTLLKKAFIEHFYKISKIDKVQKNVPPAYVFICNA